MKVSWSCGMSVGPAHWYWSGDWVFGPDECLGEGEIEVTSEEWEELDYPSKCTECGAELDPFVGHFVAEDGATSADVYRRNVSDYVPASEGKS